MKIYYDFSQFLNCSCEIYFEANSRLDIFELQLVKGFVISLKKFHSSSFFFLTPGRKKKVNKFSWNRPKITDEIIVQEDMKKFQQLDAPTTALLKLECIFWIFIHTYLKLTCKKKIQHFCCLLKGQLISKCLFGVFN